MFPSKQPQIVKRPHLVASTITLALVALAFSPRVQAQQSLPPTPLRDPPVTITRQQTAVFQDALRALAAQAHIAIVAEGTPLRSKLPEQDVPRLQEHWPLSAVVERVAASYDYETQRQGNLFILKKRFSDPNDLPDVTTGECLQALDDVVGVLSPFDYGPPQMGPGRKYPLLIGLASSLTSDQLQAMQTERGLPVVSLDERQVETVRHFALTSYVTYPAEDVRNALAYLRQASTITLRVKRERSTVTVTTTKNGRGTTQTYLQTSAFGYECRDSLHRTVFVRLDQGMAEAVGSQPHGEAEPRPESQEGLEGYTTLQAVVAALNAHGARADVDPVLRDKPVTLFGSDAIAPEEVLKALASLYGLHIRQEKDGKKRLTRPLFARASDLIAVPSAVRQVLPEPLLRAMHDGEIEELNRQSQQLLQQYGNGPPSEAQRAAGMRQQQRLARRGLDLRQLPGTLRRTAARRLRAGMEAQLVKRGTSVKAEMANNASTEPVLLASLPQADQSAFALLVLTDVLETVIHTLGRQAPSWAAHLDQCCLIGGLLPDPNRPGKQVFALTVASVDAEGALHPGTSTATEYDP